MSFHGQYLSSGLQLSKQMSYKDLVAEVWDSASKCSMNGAAFYPASMLMTQPVCNSQTAC